MLRKYKKNLRAKGIGSFNVYSNDSEQKYDFNGDEVKYFAKIDEICMIRQTGYELSEGDYLYRVIMTGGDSFITDSESICSELRLGTED